ncbi:MAG TPA: molybdopterin cofactor-binding domain-containing protein [Hyphomicrobiales bacterium]|nr:molybdopterin cofactor-binding domain-containing protein [Hyphomicrobiales bacterium]
MNEMSPLGLSRRGFLTGAAGLTFAFTLGGTVAARADQIPGGVPEFATTPGTELTVWVRIGTDGIIEIATPTAEMGQGVWTALPMMFAEELDADWDHVRPIMSPIEPKVFGNPYFRGMMVTYGSGSVQGYWPKVRMEGAIARRVLMQAAADKWGVPLSELKTEPSVVVHAASSRRLSYGEIAAFATMPATMPKVDKSELKKKADFRIVGKAMPRFDIPAKTDGAARYGIDVHVPNMVYATTLRSPVEGGKPATIDDSAAMRVPGMLKVVKMKDGVGLVAETLEAAFAGRAAVRVAWSKVALGGYDSEPMLDGHYRQRAKKVDEKGVPFIHVGDADKAFAGAAKVLSGDYTSDYVYHAQMEPMNTTASVSDAGDKAEIWIGTQVPGEVLGEAAKVLKTKPENITIHQQFLGGGYGRRGATDTIEPALELAKAMKRPVKLVWTREEDVKSAKMRPMTAHYLRAAFDADNKLIGWNHRVVAESVLTYGNPNALKFTHGIDFIVMSGAKPDYAIPNQLVEWLHEVRGTALNSWRGIGAGYNKYAIECFMDELAHAQKMDPVAFRLALTKDNPRAQAVIKATAEMAGWGRTAPEGHAYGFSFGQIVNSWTASVVEISLDRATGEIRAHNYWTAIDPGTVVNPDTVKAQMEGNVVFGLSQILKERVTLKDGEVQQNNYYDYPVLRLAEVPEIHVKVMDTDNPPTGMGEAGLPLVGSSVGNAVFALTGVRLRQMPFTPERVKGALTGA